MNKYNVAIVGCGGQGTMASKPGDSKIICFAHAVHLHKGFTNWFFADKSYAKAMEARKFWKAQWSDQIMSPFDYDHVDVIIVATPDDQHYDMLFEIAQASHKPKLVICEKPLCENLDEARHIVKLYEEKGIPLMVNYTRRFLPKYRDMKKQYDFGTYGKLKKIDLIFNRGWIHTASHAVDVANWFMDGKFDKTRFSIKESDRNTRVWNFMLDFQRKLFTEMRYDDGQVWSYYDLSHWHIIENAYNFLEGKEDIFCTGKDALDALELTYKLWEGSKCF